MNEAVQHHFPPAPVERSFTAPERAESTARFDGCRPSALARLERMDNPRKTRSFHLQRCALESRAASAPCVWTEDEEEKSSSAPRLQVARSKAASRCRSTRWTCVGVPARCAATSVVKCTTTNARVTHHLTVGEGSALLCQYPTR